MGISFATKHRRKKRKIVIYSATATLSNTGVMGVLIPLYGNPGYANKAARQLKKQIEEYVAKNRLI